MALNGYIQDGRSVNLETASARRAWMAATPAENACRCLPQTLANQHGWVIRCEQTVIARWGGGPLQSDLHRTPLGDADGGPMVRRTFGSGIATIQTPCRSKTPQRIKQWAMGPPNRNQDGAQSFSGTVETDSLGERSFRMSWKLTRPGVEVAFQNDEPFCIPTTFPRGLAGTPTAAPVLNRRGNR